MLQDFMLPSSSPKNGLFLSKSNIHFSEPLPLSILKTTCVCFWSCTFSFDLELCHLIEFPETSITGWMMPNFQTYTLNSGCFVHGEPFPWYTLKLIVPNPSSLLKLNLQFWPPNLSLQGLLLNILDLSSVLTF